MGKCIGHCRNCQLQKTSQDQNHPRTGIDGCGKPLPVVLIVRSSYRAIYQVRLIVRVRELRSQRKSEAEIQSWLGLASDFVLRKTSEQADRYSLARLKEVYHKLLNADLSIKTGRLDPELALNILIAELGQRHKLEAA